MSDAIFRKYEEFRAAAEPVAKEQHNEAMLDQLFYHNKKSRFEAGIYSTDGKPIVNMPHVKPVIDAVAGLFRQIRRDIQYSARLENNEERLAASEVMKSAGQAMLDNAGMEYLESDQDQMMLVTGIAPLEMGLHFREDPKGSMIGMAIDPCHYYYDPNATQRNLRDADYQYYDIVTSLDYAKAVLPGTELDDFLSVQQTFYLNDRPSTKQRELPPYSVKLGTGTNTSDVDPVNNVVMRTLQWRELESVRIYENPVFSTSDPYQQQQIMQALMIARDEVQNLIAKSGDYAEGFETDFNPQQKRLIIPERYVDSVEWIIASFTGEPDYDERERYCYYQSFMGQKETLDSFKTLDQSGFSCKVKTGFREPESQTWYGMARQMREPDMYLNKIQTVQLLILSKRAKDGVIAETGGMYSKEEFEQLWTQDVVLEVPDGAVSGGKIKPKAEVIGGTGYEDIYSSFVGTPAKSVGLNAEFLGMSENMQSSGVMEQQRIRQVTSVLANYTDSISLFQKEEARLLLTYLRFLAKYNDDFIVSVVGENGADKVVQLTSDIADIDYSIELGEAQLSPVMKEAGFMQLKEIAFGMLQTGSPVLLPSLIEKLDVYGFSRAEIQRLIEAMQPKPDPQQQQQLAERQALETEAAQIELMKKKADTQKTMAEVQKMGVDAAKTEAEADKTEKEVDKVVAETSKVLTETALARSQPAQTTVNL